MMKRSSGMEVEILNHCALRVELTHLRSGVVGGSTLAPSDSQVQSFLQERPGR
jgi:hypothetical protein